MHRDGYHFGTPVVLKDGPLGESLRATMAIPGLFTPVEVDGRLLADGGILNNLPVDAVREMGADIVIAVLMIASPVRQDAVISFIGMIDRSFDLMVLQNELRSMREAEIGVILDLAPFGSGDYKSGDAIADLGYRGMEKKAAVLERLSVDQSTWESHFAQRKARVRTSAPVTQFVQVEGTRAEAATAIAGRLSDTIGKPWNREHVRPRAAHHRLGRYDSLGYGFLRAGEQAGLAVRAREKVHAPPFLHLGWKWTAAKSITSSSNYPAA